VAPALRRGWFPVAHSSGLATPVQTSLLGVELVVFRAAGGQVRVASNQCPHRGAALSGGRVVEDGIECPYHGWTWDGATGSCTRIPALGPDGVIPPAARLTTYEVQERYGIVWTTLSREPVGEVPAFEQVDALDLETGWLCGPPWDVGCNICAAVENFRDVAHLPFVHRETMGVLPHEVEPLNPVRKGFHAFLERAERSYDADTSDPVWAETHTGATRISYHAIAPSAVSIVVSNTAHAGKRAVVFAVAPTSLESSRWFFAGDNTAGYPPTPTRSSTARLLRASSKRPLRRSSYKTGPRSIIAYRL
jgi:phenylpropionate dioxygenase-like ring-hydroxylating dioxygenase large terminal subunit